MEKCRQALGPFLGHAITCWQGSRLGEHLCVSLAADMCLVEENRERELGLDRRETG